MADLTRFDFHALRFMESEDVSAMSAEEVGQYILLMAKSWLMAKDCSLPNDLEFLARVSRSKKVSDRVLRKFPVVEIGGTERRQNPTLFGEWMATNSRMQMASETGRAGSEKRWGGDRVPIASPSGAFRVAEINLCPRPDQTVPSQTNPDREGISGQCTFKNIAIHYSSFFGISHSHGKKHIEKYQTACSKYGEDVVLDYFDRWAGGAGWLRERRDSNGLNFFWKPLDEMVAGDELRQDREESVRKVNSDDDLVVRMQEALKRDQEQEKIEEKNRQTQKEFEAANKDNF